MEPLAGTTVLLKRMGIDTHEEPIVYMRADCHVCRSEVFSPVTTERASIIATLNVVRDGFVLPTEAGLSEVAWQLPRSYAGANCLTIASEARRVPRGGAGQDLRTRLHARSGMSQPHKVLEESQ